jgi:hypothetical protein
VNDRVGRAPDLSAAICTYGPGRESDIVVIQAQIFTRSAWLMITWSPRWTCPKMRPITAETCCASDFHHGINVCDRARERYLFLAVNVFIWTTHSTCSLPSG